MSSSLPSFDQYSEKMMEFISKWMNKNNPDSERLFTFVAMEKIFLTCGVKHSIVAEVKEMEAEMNAETASTAYRHLVDKLTDDRACSRSGRNPKGVC